MKYIVFVLMLLFPILTFAQNEQIIIEISQTLTPNKEKNNVFKVKSVSIPYEILYFKVFNRWGNEVYTSKSNDAEWDGTEKGKELPSGTYYYSIKLRLANGKKEELTGFVNLIR